MATDQMELLFAACEFGSSKNSAELIFYYYLTKKIIRQSLEMIRRSLFLCFFIIENVFNEPDVSNVLFLLRSSSYEI